MRGSAIRPCSGFPSTGSSLGAMIGSRSGRLAEAWPRRFCITRLVIVIRLTGACEGGILGCGDMGGCKDPGEKVDHQLRGIEGDWQALESK